MPYATAAGPAVGASWRTIRVLSDVDGAPLRRAGALVVEDASSVGLAQPGRPRVYYALPAVPFVARDSAGRPALSLVLMLSRSPTVDEDSVHHLIQQSVLDCDLSLELSRAALVAIAKSKELAAGNDADVRPLFVREARFTLRPASIGSGVSPTAIATARSTGGAAARASLQATLNREQTLGLLAALDGASSNLALTSEVTYRVSGVARRRLSGDWSAVHDYISPRLESPSAITRNDLSTLFDDMVRARVLLTSVSPAGGHASQSADEGSVPRAAAGVPPAKRGDNRGGASAASARASVRTAPAKGPSRAENDSGSLFDAFIRQAIVILRRLTPDLPSADPGNSYALRARPSAGFRLEHSEEYSGDSLETVTIDTAIEGSLEGILDGHDRDAFIRLVSLTSASGGGAGSGGFGPPPRPQRFVQPGGPRWPGDRPSGSSGSDRQAGSDRIAMAVADGELRSVAHTLRPELSSSTAVPGRNAQAMIASGVARPIVQGLVPQAATLHWYLDDWRIDPHEKEQPRHLPVVTAASDSLWRDRIDANALWYAPTFELLQPAPNSSVESSPFLFSFRRIGETPSGPALEGEIRFTLRRGMSDETRQALAARGNPAASPVPTGNLAVSLVLPFINADDNALTRHTCPCAISTDGSDVTATIALTTQWVRIAYTLLSHPSGSVEPARISVAYSYEAYSVVRRSNLHLAVGAKEATIPVVYSADQRRETQGTTYMDAKASTLNFSDGALHLRREAPIAPRRQLEPWGEALHERGVATAGMVAVAARPEVLARPEVVAVNRPAVLGAIATPALRPGIELVDIVAETSYALRTLLRQEQHDAEFPCEALGAFYRETDDDSDVAVGCLPAMELGKVSYRRYERIPELDAVVGGETRFQVYRSLQQPGRFLVLPARYVITRHPPGTADAYKPRLLLYSDEDPERALRTPIIFTADLQPDILPHARRALELELAALAEDPVVEYPTAIEGDTAFLFHAMDSTPVSAFRTPDSFSVSISATAADWPLLFTRVQTGGVLGQVRFILGDGTEMTSNLALDLRHITGPWLGGAVTAERTGSGVRLTNQIDRPVSVHDLLIVSDGASRMVPVERTIAAGSADTVPVESLGASAEIHVAYTTPASPEAIEAVPNAIERIHINVLVTNQILFSNHALTLVTVFVRRLGASAFEQIQVGPETTVAQVDFLLPLTEYIARPTIQLRIVKAFSDGRTETREWFDWDLNAMGFVVSLTWGLVQ